MGKHHLLVVKPLDPDCFIKSDGYYDSTYLTLNIKKIITLEDITVFSGSHPNFIFLCGKLTRELKKQSPIL
jgi:hypothetical protein